MITSIFVIIFIINIVAFVLSVPLNGYITACIITYGAYDKRYAHEDRVRSILDYFDFVGAFCFFFLKIGWGAIAPIDREFINGSYRNIRTAIAYAAQPLASIIVAITSIIPSIYITNKECVMTALHMFFVNSLSSSGSQFPLEIFQKGYPAFSHCSAYAITAALFLVGVMYVQINILCVSLVLNTFNMFLHPFKFTLMKSQYYWLYMIAMPLLFCLLFYNFFLHAAVNCILFFIYIISSLIKGY